MLAAARSMADAVCTPLLQARWVSFLGSSGAGKTMLARLIYRQAFLFARKHPYLESSCFLRRVHFCHWPKVAEQLRNGDHFALEKAEAAWFLVVDDIGAEYQAQSNFIPSKLYNLCNQRMHKWTVFTSNLAPEDIDRQMDPRITSRMYREGNQVLSVQVPDWNRPMLTA